MSIYRTISPAYILVQNICGVFYLSENPNPTPETNVEYERIGNTTYEITNFYDGDVSLLELIKNALLRDAETVLRNQDNA